MDEFLFLDVSALVLVGVSASGLLSPCVPSFCSFFGLLCRPRVCFLYLSRSMAALSFALFSFLCFCGLSSRRFGSAFAPFGLCLPFVSVGVRAFSHLCLICHFGSPCFEFDSESGCWCPSLIDICPQCPPIVLGCRPGPCAFACLLWAGSPNLYPRCCLAPGGMVGWGILARMCLSL